MNARNWLKKHGLSESRLPDVLYPGLQVAYIPWDGCSEREIEFGFVFDCVEGHNYRGSVPVRYWSSWDACLIRTVANSELTPMDRLWLVETRPASLVGRWLEALRKWENIARERILAQERADTVLMMGELGLVAKQ